MTRLAAVPRGAVWLAGLLLVAGALRVVFGLAAVAGGSLPGLASALVGAVLLVEAAGVAWTRPWGWRLGVGVHGLDVAGAAVVVALAPSLLFPAVPLAGVDAVALWYLLSRRRHFRREPLGWAIEPAERQGRFEG